MAVQDMTRDGAAAFEDLLEFLKRDRAFDFTGYKRSSLMRRASSRMEAVGVEHFGHYIDHLQVDPAEFTNLFDALMINVTGFFRDPAAWDFLSRQVMPELVAGKAETEPIRVWSAGCASGEEPFSLAILLAEQLGMDVMRERVKIYGTDPDEDALASARQALYPAKAMAGVPEELLARYFEPAGAGYRVAKELRRSVIFGRHDLVHAAPISHIDLLACRNTLMYFNAETQARVLNRLHFALEDGGVLFLGRAEMITNHGNLFTPVDLNRRIFTKVAKGTLRERITVISDGGSRAALDHPVDYRGVRAAAGDASALAQVVVHESGTLAFTNTTARHVFGLAESDVGRPFRDLEISYRPVELRSAMARAEADRLPVVIEGIEYPGGPGDSLSFDVHVVPLFDLEGKHLGAAISFLDVTLSMRLRTELESSNRELETAYEELQSTNEELETSNEELQSAFEELETTNEELQSTIEELEAMNTDLHSTNEELQTINDEMRRRSGEVDDVNRLLESLLEAQLQGFVVVDRERRVTLWNSHSSELWGLQSDEVRGRHLLDLDFGLPTEGLGPGIRAIIAGNADHHEVTLAAINRKGREFECQVTLGPLLDRDRQVRGVILLMRDGAVDGRPAPSADGRVSRGA